MLSSMLHALPILAAEKSKVPFFIAGGALALWAVIISMAVGMRRVNFPGSKRGERGVISVTVVLVLAAMSTAVITAGVPTTTTSTAAATRPSVPPSSAPPPSGAPATSAHTVALAANPTGLLKFDKSTITVPAGKITIDFANMSPLMHNVTVAKGTSVLGATPTFQGGSHALTVTLSPGTYSFYCSVPGHRAAGMNGTLIVTKPGSAPPTSNGAPPPSGAATTSAHTVALAANPTGLLKFDKSTITVPAGKITIDFANMSPLMHNVTVAKGTSVLGATPTFQGGSRALTVTLSPGTYSFYCSVPGHRAAGMNGTLIVTK